MADSAHLVSAHCPPASGARETAEARELPLHRVTSVLVVDDEANIRRMVGALLGAEGYDVREAPDGLAAIAAADDEPDVILLDLMMPGVLDGLATLERLRERHPEIPVIMMSGRATLSDAVRATQLGAFNFLEKPLTPETVLLSAGAAAELRGTRRAARALRDDLGLGRMIGESAAMQAVRALITRVADTGARVLITGESGTGKELVAAAIHDASGRADRAFVRVNCAAIPRDLVESEMFGHEKGAFTGATQSRAGRFELAHRGTLFLDEVGDLSAEAQAKLLRAIELGEIQRVGGNRSIRADVRIVAATNQDLARAVAEGQFREDLYFRLNVVPVALPPLRDRLDDIEPLVTHFLDRHHRATGRVRSAWSSAALSELRAYHWPGNVRELANVVERLSILYPGVDITVEHVREVLPHAGPRSSSDEPPVGVPGSLTVALDEYERALIVRTLREARGNVAEAARRLQTDRPNLYRRMRRLGVDATLG
jgi:two-component system, NtrC family, nitrogen regulation response regulator NtrX